METLAGDLTDPARMGTLGELVRTTMAGLDHLVPAAGIIDRSPIEQMSDAHFDRVLNINISIEE